jgi:uracil-DNA glycosylase
MEVDDIYEGMKIDPAFKELRGTDNPFVPGEGTEEGAKAFIIGEAPGAQEAIKRRPFVGPAGAIQRRLMAIAGLRSVPSRIDVTRIDQEPREYVNGAPANCWLTNVLHYRPPGNRKPTLEEIRTARPYLVDEWKAVGSPKLVIPVGSTAIQTVTNTNMSILKVSGRVMTFPSSPNVYVWPMIHPSFGLRQPAMQPIIEKDWRKLARWMLETELK